MQIHVNYFRRMSATVMDVHREWHGDYKIVDVHLLV